jgi:hypothetical protein
MKLSGLLCLVALISIGSRPLAAASLCDAMAGNLVQNCGFETGDFTNWTLTGNLGFTGVAGNFAGMDPNSGNFQAYWGAIGSDTSAAQTLATGVGTNYVFSFYVANFGGTESDFTAFWDSTPLLSFVDSGSQPYTLYQYQVVGTGSDTIDFSFRQDPAFWLADDISVVDATAPEPGTIGLMLAGLGAVLASRRRRA